MTGSRGHVIDHKDIECEERDGNGKVNQEEPSAVSVREKKPSRERFDECTSCIARKHLTV